MKISLVTATLGRVDEIEDLLISLIKQTFQNFELIIVDQNEHTLVEKVVRKYDKKLAIVYVRSDKKGLSLNRNIGIAIAKGDIIGFPDDDCFYSETVLEEVIHIFNKSNLKFVAVEAVDIISKRKFIVAPNRILNRKDVLKTCISYNVFLKFDKAVKFDERLGVGAKFSSGEETDYLWAVLLENDQGDFAKNAIVFHPQNESSDNLKRAYNYGLGFGAIFKKEYFRHKKITVLYEFTNYILRSFGGIIISKNRKFYYKTLLGRINGFINFKVH